MQTRPRIHWYFLRVGKKRERSLGFTLLELILVVAAFAIIAVVAVPISNSSLVRGNLDSAERTVESSLRRAYSYARSGENASDWGVYTTATNTTVFSGSTYEGRAAALDESNATASITVGGTVSSEGTALVIFAKDTGVPSPTGTLTLTAAGKTKTITINAAGAILVE